MSSPAEPPPEDLEGTITVAPHPTKLDEHGVPEEVVTHVDGVPVATARTTDVDVDGDGMVDQQLGAIPEGGISAGSVPEPVVHEPASAPVTVDTRQSTATELTISRSEAAVLYDWLPAMRTYSMSDEENEILNGLFARVEDMFT